MAIEIKIQNFSFAFAVREAKFEHSFAISELERRMRPQSTNALADAARRNNRNRIEFQHDLAAEWARFQRLKEIADQPAQWAAYAMPAALARRVANVREFLLRELVNGRPAWDVALEQLKSEQNTLGSRHPSRRAVPGSACRTVSGGSR